MKLLRETTVEEMITLISHQLKVSGVEGADVSKTTYGSIEVNIGDERFAIGLSSFRDYYKTGDSALKFETERPEVDINVYGSIKASRLISHVTAIQAAFFMDLNMANEIIAAATPEETPDEEA